MIFAFARRFNNTVFIIVVPLHLGTLFDSEIRADVNTIRWDDTRVVLTEFELCEYTNLLNDKTLNPGESITIADLFHEVPFGFIKAKRIWLI